MYDLVQLTVVNIYIVPLIGEIDLFKIVRIR